MSGMTKVGTGAKIEDSNIALLGSQLEKDVKKAAAKSEAAWKGAGESEGCQVWRIEKFEVKDWPKEKYGSFYDGDCYIVLHSFKRPGSKKMRHNIHFWLGSNSSQDEQGVAAYKSVELDDVLGQVPVQYREVEGHESPAFDKLFPSIQLLSGGVDSGFNKVKPTEYKARLLHVKGKLSGTVVNQVPLELAALNPGDCFVLDAGLKLFQWNGTGSNPAEKIKARKVCDALKAERSLGDGEDFSYEIVEGLEDEAKEFWKYFSLEGPPKALETKATSDAVAPASFSLFKISDETGELKFSKVKEGKISVSDFNINDVFILDLGIQLYVWVGRGASKEERSKGMVFAMSYLGRMERPLSTPIVRVLEGAEPQGFLDAVEGAEFSGEAEYDAKEAATRSAKAKAAETKAEEVPKRMDPVSGKALSKHQLPGGLLVTVHEAKDLRNTQTFGTQDPFCVVKLGKHKHRTGVQEDGGKAATWDHAMKFELSDRAGEYPLFQVRNDNMLIDAMIGTCGSVPLFVALKGMEKKWLDIETKGSKNAGQILVSSQHLKPTSVRVNNCRDLRSRQLLGKQDPYVVLNFGKRKCRTPTDNNGSKNPNWSTDNVFDFNFALVEDLKHEDCVVTVTVYNDNTIKDDLIGYTTIPALMLFEAKKGKQLELDLMTGKSAKAKQKGKISLTIV